MQGCFRLRIFNHAILDIRAYISIFVIINRIWQFIKHNSFNQVSNIITMKYTEP